jgi:hypothetical protein
MAFDITRSKSTRSLQSRAASILCGVLFLIPLANVAFADAKDVIKQILDEAIPQLQNTMASISQGCSGGSGGVPPLNWQARQESGNLAVQALSAGRAALGEGRTTDARQQINSGLSQWDTLINSLAASCSGGPSGENPVNYGNYVRFRDVMKERLQTALRFL